MKFFKKHLVETILTVIFVAILLTAGITIYMMWNQSSGSVYGNRLEGINKVEIKDDKLEEVATEIKKNTIISKANGEVEGRIINFFITVNKGTSKADAKKATDVIIPLFSEEELEFYDVQIFIDEADKEEASTYPIIGYKSKISTKLVWTNN